MICLVDYGMGNLFSVEKALAAAGADVATVSAPDRVRGADAVVLPGVGHFGKGMENLRAAGLDKAVADFISTGRPFLGICLGMQLLMEESEEAPGRGGIGIFKGQVLKFPKSSLKVPQMGWNSVELRQDNPFMEGIPDNSHFYFVHSYYVSPDDPAIVAGQTGYGIPFCSAIGSGNVFATQFHPEKSQNAGLRILRNFVGICGREEDRR